MNLDLFAADDLQQPERNERIGEQSWVLRGFALPWVERLLPALQQVLLEAPFRQMVTPGGFTMSASLSSCGTWGWTTDRSGYRYSAVDPQTGRPWPAMPDVFRQLAVDAAQRAGFAHFIPDACLINRYVPGAKMSLHQDRNEQDFSAPVVSISLGLPAMFLFGGHERSDKTLRVPLFHGD
ncbi:DNA oxidative demethylase AlkB, partial [Pseudomonas gingeri]